MFEKLIDKLHSWSESVVLMLPNLGGALAVLILSWIIARFLRRLTMRLMMRLSVQRSLTDLVGKTTSVACAIIGFVIALHILDLERAATTFLAGAGIVGLALGFAFQDLTANFIAGVALAVRKPLEVGNLIEVKEVFGRIEQIQLRSTLVKTPDGRAIIVPNRLLFEDALVNHSLEGNRRVDLTVGVSYGEDLEEVAELVTDAVGALPMRLENRDVELFFQEFDDSSINFVVRFWIEFDNSMAAFHRAKHAAIIAITRTFRDNGITIPFPIRTLDFGAEDVGGRELPRLMNAAS